MKPNVILIIVDQMRRDCLGAMGHDIVETPNLDAMKKNGHMFTRAYSSVPTCIAARAAIMTGLNQRNHGRVGYRDGVAWNYETTIAGEFAKAGYHTQCVGKMHVAPSRNLVGYHNVVLHDGYLHYSRDHGKPDCMAFAQSDDYLRWLRQKMGVDADLTDFGMECNSWTARPWGYAEELHPTNWVVSESIDFLRRRDPTKPFFLTTSFVRPHSPLDPPQVYYDMYIDQPFLPPLMGEWAEMGDPEQEALNTDCSRGVLNQRALHRARAAYYGMITHIDHQLGRFIQALGEYRVLKDSVILFVSDHGDLLGDHNLFRKSLPYEGSAGVPFILYDPGKLLGDLQNDTYDHVTELRDIMPTLLDAAGLNIPASLDGRSVLPLLHDKKAPWREYIHGEHSGGDKVANHYITDGKMKYLWFSQTGREQFFDLNADPGELRDVIADGEYAAHIERFRGFLIRELNGREEGYTDGKRLIAGRKPQDILSEAGLGL